MNEFWVVFWNSFQNVCHLEFRNVSLGSLIIFLFFGAIVVHIGCLIYVRVKRHSIYLSTEIIIILLISYTAFIAQVTLLSRELEGTARVFDTKWLRIDESMDQNITNLLNIALFIPFGVLIAVILINRNGLKRIIMAVNYCFLTSLLIECTQYLTKRGYFEIDDIEANIVGGLSGSIFFSLLSKIGKSIHKKNVEVNDGEETQS